MYLALQYSVIVQSPILAIRTPWRDEMEMRNSSKRSNIRDRSDGNNPSGVDLERGHVRLAKKPKAREQSG